MSYKIIDEVKDLLPMYRPKNSEIGRFMHLLTKHYKRFGRIGLHTNPDKFFETAARLYKHFTEDMTPGALSAEWIFLRALIKSDMSGAVEEGLQLAKSVLPDRRYKDPKIVLVLDGNYSNAKVLEGKESYGVNANFLYNQSKNLDLEQSIKEAMRGITCMTAHEANHIYLNQIKMSDWPKDKDCHPLYEIAFSEGLATFVEQDHLMQHFGHLHDIERWIKALRIITSQYDGNSTKESYEGPYIGEFFREVADISSLREFNREAAQKVEFAIFQDSGALTIDDEASREKQKRNQMLVTEVLKYGNGPIYHIGYHMWKTIADCYGIGKVKELVLQRPGEFVKTYDQVAGN